MEKQVRYFRCKKAKLPSSRNADSLYYTTDTGELFLGPKQIGINVPELSILTNNNSSSSTPVIYKNNASQTQLDVDLVNTKGLFVQTATTFLCDILPSEKDTYKLGSSDMPFAEAHVKNIKTVNTITRPASATNAIEIGLENSGNYTGAYFRLSSSPNTQIPTIGLKGNILPDTSGGASGAKYNIGSEEYKFNEIHAVTIDEINSRLDALGFKSGNLTYNNINIGKIARLGKVAYGYLCASNTTITESSTIIYQEIYSVNGVLSDNSVLPEDIVGKTFRVDTFTTSAELIISSYTDTVGSKRLIFHTIRLNRGEINLRLDTIKYTFWVATDSFDILLK